MINIHFNFDLNTSKMYLLLKRLTSLLLSRRSSTKKLFVCGVSLHTCHSSINRETSIKREYLNFDRYFFKFECINFLHNYKKAFIYVINFIHLTLVKVTFLLIFHVKMTTF